MNPNTNYQISQLPTVINLPYENATELDLALLVNEGSGIDVDWGDGVIQNIPTTNSYTTKVFGSPTTGVAQIFTGNRATLIRSRADAWRFDLPIFLIPKNLTSFDFIGNISGNIENTSRNLIRLKVQGATGDVTGSLAGLQDGIQYINASGFQYTLTANNSELLQKTQLVELIMRGATAVDIDLASFPTTVNDILLDNHTSSTQNHKVTYTSGKTWASTMKRVLIEAAPGFGLNQTEINQLLIDLDNDTTDWVSAQQIRLTQNHASPNIAIPEVQQAILNLEAKGVTVEVNDMERVYVDSTVPVNGDGSQASPWKAFSDIVWAEVEGKQLTVLNTFTELLTVSINNCVIDFTNGNIDATGLSTGMNIEGYSNIILETPKVNNATVQNIYYENTNVIVNDADCNDSLNQSFQHWTDAVVTYNNVKSHGNADESISGHENSIITLNGTLDLKNNTQAAINFVQSSKVIINGTPDFENNTRADIYVVSGTTRAGISLTINNSVGDNFGKIEAENECTINLNGGVYELLDLTECDLFADGIIARELQQGADLNLNIDNSRIENIESSTNLTNTLTATNSSFYISGIFDYKGTTFNATRCLFDGTNATDHNIDFQTGTTVNLKYCIFTNMNVNDYGFVFRSGVIPGIIEGLTIYDPAQSGRGIFTQVSFTAKNVILTGLDEGVRTSDSGVTVTLDNLCMYNNSSDVEGTGTVVQNNPQTTDPLLTDPANLDFSLAVGSSCIDTGTTPTTTQGILTAAWGDINTPPVIVETALTAPFNIGAI